MSDDLPVPAPQSESLQFEHADFTAAPALVCATCQQPIADAYYEISGKTLCGLCRDRIAAQFVGGSGLARFMRALLLGGLAALGGTMLYFLVLAVTGYEIALIAIFVGFMVGAAVRKGTRHRGGLAYQILAVFLTYTSIVSAYVPVMVTELVKQRKAQPPAVAAADPAPAVAKEAGKVKQNAEQTNEETPPAAAKAEARQPAPELGPAKVAGPAPGVAQVLLLLVVLVGLVYATPFLAGAQNLVGLLIIFFGLLQAWRMNRRVSLTINGPFQVTGGVPPPQELPADA